MPLTNQKELLQQASRAWAAVCDALDAMIDESDGESLHNVHMMMAAGLVSALLDDPDREVAAGALAAIAKRAEQTLEHDCFAEQLEVALAFWDIVNKETAADE